MRYVKVIGSELLKVFGALWLIIEATNYFVSQEISLRIRGLWWLFLLTAIVISVIRLVPKRRFSFLLNKRDITMELVVGDILKQTGPIVVGSNTSFITSEQIIARNSIQGTFCKKYFTSLHAVNDQITAQAPNLPYEFGTTVTIRGESRTGYFCAVAEINESGVAKSDIESIRVALGGLWSYLANHAEKDVVNVPILGPGFSRVSATREELFREIVLSFIAAANESTFCDGIRIVLYPKDVKQYGIDVGQLASFLEYNCKHATSEPRSAGVGTEE